jgi:hypothetical protein
MPFPFLPLGAVLAASILIGALTVFGLVLRTIDRGLVALRDTMASGLVSGLRRWNEGSGPMRRVVSSPGATPTGDREVVDLGSRRI